MALFHQPAIKSTAVRQGIVLFMLAIVAALVLPNYWTQNWNWNHLPPIVQSKSLRQLQQTGLQLDGWQTLDQRSIQIGGQDWSVQAIVPQESAAATPQTATLLFLRPQTWIRDLPQVEWMDINGMQQWQTDSARSIQFTLTAPNGQSVPVTARFLRGWSEERTYAVMQWYAWSTGGSPDPMRWFWANQTMRWHREPPLPWVAVSLLQPIAPLESIETVQRSLESLAQQIQAALLETVLQLD